MADRFTETEITNIQNITKTAFQEAWEQIEFVSYPLIEDPDNPGTFVEDESNATTTSAEYSAAIAGLAENLIDEVMQAIFDKLNTTFPVSS